MISPLLCCLLFSGLQEEEEEPLNRREQARRDRQDARAAAEAARQAKEAKISAYREKQERKEKEREERERAQVSLCCKAFGAGLYHCETPAAVDVLLGPTPPACVVAHSFTELLVQLLCCAWPCSCCRFAAPALLLHMQEGACVSKLVQLCCVRTR
jgi:hypothetical protein